MQKSILLLLATTHAWAIPLDEYLTLKAAHKQQKAELKAAYAEQKLKTKQTKIRINPSAKTSLTDEVQNAYEKMMLARNALLELNAALQDPPKYSWLQIGQGATQKIADLIARKHEHLREKKQSLIAYVHCRQQVEEKVIRLDYDSKLESKKNIQKCAFASLIVPALIVINLPFSDFPKKNICFFSKSLTFTDASLGVCAALSQGLGNLTSLYKLITASHKLYKLFATEPDDNTVTALSKRSILYFLGDFFTLWASRNDIQQICSERDKAVTSAPLYVYLKYLTHEDQE